MERSKKRQKVLHRSPIVLRKTERREQDKLSHVRKKVPKDIWIKIFGFLTCRESTVSTPSDADRVVDALVNCQLTCKWWYQIAKSHVLWFPLIDNVPYEVRQCHSHLTVLRRSEVVEYNGIILDSRTTLAPHTYYAQVTFRGISKKKVTVTILDKWFRKKQYTLLFQALSPLMSMYIGVQVYDSIPKLWDPNQHLVKNFFQHIWGNRETKVTWEHGNMFIIKWNDEYLRFNREPKHLVFHADHFKDHTWYYGTDTDNINHQRCGGDKTSDPGIFLEQRQLLRLSSGVSDYSSTRISSEFIWYGIQCMLELHRAGQYIWYNDENKKLWKSTFS